MFWPKWKKIKATTKSPLPHNQAPSSTELLNYGETKAQNGTCSLHTSVSRERTTGRQQGWGQGGQSARTQAPCGPAHLPVVYLWNSCILSGHVKTFICTHRRSGRDCRGGSGHTNMSAALSRATKSPSKEEKLEEHLAGIRVHLQLTR